MEETIDTIWLVENLMVGDFGVTFPRISSTRGRNLGPLLQFPSSVKISIWLYLQWSLSVD